MALSGTRVSEAFYTTAVSPPDAREAWRTEGLFGCNGCAISFSRSDCTRSMLATPSTEQFANGLSKC